MKYKIIDYRPVQSSDKSYYFIEVKIKHRSYTPLFFIPIWKTKWIMTGRDGHPRFFERAGNKYHSDNRLLIVKTEAEAHKKISEFKLSNIKK